MCMSFVLIRSPILHVRIFFMISWYWIPLLFGCFGIRKIQIKYGQYKAHIHKR